MYKAPSTAPGIQQISAQPVFPPFPWPPSFLPPGLLPTPQVWVRSGGPGQHWATQHENVGDESGLQERGAHPQVPEPPVSCQLLQREHTSYSGGSDLRCPWAGWLISSVTTIRSLCNHIQVQITGPVSEPVTPEPGLSSWHLLAGVTRPSGSGGLPQVGTRSTPQHVRTAPYEPTRRTLPNSQRNAVWCCS